MGAKPVVLTMGKVASSSVSQAIRKAGLPCYDIHTLNVGTLCSASLPYLQRGELPPQHYAVSMAYRDRLLTKKSKCLYISLVRDPIARNLSAYFQNLDLSAIDPGAEGAAQALFDDFVARYAHTLPLAFFDRQFGDELGIDIYRYRFPHAARYLHIPEENTVLFRVDCPDAVKSRVLSRLLDRKIVIGRDNDSETKAYRDLYRAVKAVARFSPAFVGPIYKHRFSQHFWSGQELYEMRNKWIGTSAYQI